MTRKQACTYSLDSIHSAIRRGSYWISRTASQGAAELDLDEEDVKECVLGLRTADFYKTMPSEKRPGLFQDVYRCRHTGLAIYTKLQLSRTGEGVVISFKRDEGA